MYMVVSEAVLSMLNGEGMTLFLNSTFFALIFKKFKDDSVSDFRLISLDNFFMNWY